MSNRTVSIVAACVGTYIIGVTVLTLCLADVSWTNQYSLADQLMDFAWGTMR